MKTFIKIVLILGILGVGFFAGGAVVENLREPLVITEYVEEPFPVLMHVPVMVKIPVPYRNLTDLSYVSPISSNEAILILEEAKDSHAYFVYVEPEDVAFHALWVERYEQLIKYVEDNQCR